LVADIVQQGNLRYLAHVTTSTSTPPHSYYYISIYASTPTEEPISPNQPSVLKTTYPMRVIVVDYIYGDFEDEELYEKPDISFVLLTDRLVILFGTLVTSPVIYESQSFRIPRSDQAITKSNRDTNWEDAEQYHAVKYTEILFNLEGC